MILLDTLARAGLDSLVKPIKYFVDSHFRAMVTPLPGSVVYCDLAVAFEHSGIYVGEGSIASIVVDSVAQSSVTLENAACFTSPSTLGGKIYVSCDPRGAVGSEAVSTGAMSHVGEKSFYGLIINNCHQFSSRCLGYAAGESRSPNLPNQFAELLLSEAPESTLLGLKAAARARLGATKWRLWDWNNQLRENPPVQPDWQAIDAQLHELTLDDAGIAYIRAERATLRNYLAEIADEDIPAEVLARLAQLGQTLNDIEHAYNEAAPMFRQCPGAHFSHADLQACQLDWQALAHQMRQNPAIRSLAYKLGRNYISEARKRRTRIPQTSRSEMHGTCHGADVQRMLPSELLNLEDELLETLFYARLMEEHLLCYQLSGISFIQGEQTERQDKRTGPVVACLDTSGSMSGQPLLKARALLVAIAGILKAERRSLHVLLFGSSGELHEFSMHESNDAAGLLRFLQQGFGGGTDFEAPLRRALDIIRTEENYLKADVLMISDGDCVLSDEFAAGIKATRDALDCTVYSVLCNGARKADNFSDEIITL